MDESSTMKEWRAALLGQLPTAETGHDKLNLTVECMTMAVHVSVCVGFFLQFVCFCSQMGVCVCVCVFLLYKWKKQGSNNQYLHQNLPQLCLSIQEYPMSATHTCLWPTYTITRPHTDVYTHSCWHLCTLKLNTGLFVHSASLVCTDGEQIWSTWVSELWSRKCFLPWFRNETCSGHSVIRWTFLK